MTPPRIIPPAAQRHAANLGLTITHEDRMSDAFVKYHLNDGRALHHFTQAEPHADPHDHPCRMEIEVLSGGYDEHVFQVGADDWTLRHASRLPGTSHVIEPEHIHRIAYLPAGECWTLCRYAPHVRATRFWRFAERIESRRWDEGVWHG